MKLPLENAARLRAPRIVARAKLPARAGHYELVAFAEGGVDLPHVALVRGGDLAGATEVPVRIHAECLAGDALGSLRCDCRAELDRAMDALADEPRGVLLYLRGEGRGMRTLAGARCRGREAAPIDHAAAAALLRALGVASVAGPAQSR